MDTETSLLALAALAQPTRLQAFRLLVRHAPDGLPAGEVARQLAVPQNTLSAHLGVLARAGLVRAARHSRQLVYQAELGQLRALLLFLAKECCDGRPELCGPLVAELTPGCPAPAQARTC